MKIIEASVELLTPINRDEILRHIEKCGRVCYKSESRITEDSAGKFCKGIIKSGHEAVIEHYNITVKFICDRGVTHEIVRHRMASYCQESTRYCNYSNDKFNGEITVIKPCYWDTEDLLYWVWELGCIDAEQRYFQLLDIGAKPQEARAVLPNSLKTELIMTANIREWRHFLKLRCDKAAHPQMREVANMLYDKMNEQLPELFSDIKENIND